MHRLNSITAPLNYLALALATVAIAPLEASAQSTRAPEGTIEITVGCSAGCTPDILMRRAAQIWNNEHLIENPIVIVNRPGGGMTTAMNYVLDRPGDENNLMALAEPVFSTPIVQGLEATYNKFTPLGVFVQTQLIMLARPDHEANTLAEIVEIARARPAEIKMAGSSAGGTDDQILGLVKAATGTDMTFIPHSGGGAAQATFLGGNTDLITLTIDEALPLIKSGKAKPLAILNESRRTEADLSAIPTAREQGIDVVWGQVFGILGTPGLKPDVVAWWTGKIGELVSSESWKKSIADNYLGGEVFTGPDLPARMESLNAERLKVLKAIGAAKS